MVEPEIICEQRGEAGVVVLNRPDALNALTLGMVGEIAAALDRWESDCSVTRILITAAGSRAFCSGGDVRLLYGQGRSGDHAAQLRFWREEYALNRRIKHYSKPTVALIDGIVMGGGVGVSIHARHRVAGGRFLFAMPEVGIGFFPDVGATYFLPRLPGRIGTYLALTGARAGAGDAVACGIATAFVASDAMAALAKSLCAPGAVNDAIANCTAPAPSARIASERDWIDECFAAPTVSEILARLDAAAAETAPAGEAARAIRANAPLSLSIALRQMRMGPDLDIDAAMETEFRIVSRLCRGSDFYEGVRAAIIDRDGRPNWRPATLEGVTEAQVEAHFAPLAATAPAFERQRSSPAGAPA